MPPAFNLSQDQTLQFDLVKAKLILTLNLIPPNLAAQENKLLVQCEHFVLSWSPVPSVAQEHQVHNEHPHLSVANC